jgi:uncharacterized protein YeaO (DUF488 family)
MPAFSRNPLKLPLILSLRFYRSSPKGAKLFYPQRKAHKEAAPFPTGLSHFSIDCTHPHINNTLMTNEQGNQRVKTVYTVGYEGRSIEEFIRHLKQFHIKALIDVREIPASRKKDFSKKSLSKHLASVGIRYLHVKELGSPSELRNKVRTDNDYDYFFSEYSRHLDNNIELLKSLLNETISNETSCLMCMERLPTQCHRKVVAERIKKIIGNGLQIRHI